MNLTIPFLAAIGAAVATNFLDWNQTVALIKAKGLAGETNPIMRFLMGKSKWLGLAYKMWPYPTLVYFGMYRWRDIQNYLVQYGNAPAGQVDRYQALSFVFTALFGAGVGLYGYLKGRKK